MEGLSLPSLESNHFGVIFKKFNYFIFLIYGDSTSIHQHHSQARLSGKSWSWVLGKGQASLSPLPPVTAWTDNTR